MKKTEDHNTNEKVCSWHKKNHKEKLSEEPSILAKNELHSVKQFDNITAITSLITYIYNKNMW